MNTRTERAKLNIAYSLLSQLVVLICGLIVPRMMLSAFGSEAYGTVNSITSFLAYITLVEGGIGGVARAALYKPLANEDINEINSILGEVKHFFRIIAYAFVGYALIIACSFKNISNLQSFDWGFIFFLVVVCGISIFAEYYIGITYSVLIQASQRTYVIQKISIVATIINTIVIVVFIKCGCNIIIVKLASGIVLLSKPIALSKYARKNYGVVPAKKRNKKALEQKWTGLGQHIAFFLHSNTDIVVLTLFLNLKAVAVYAVYNMIISKIQSIVVSFTSGMEALFGDMLSKKEFDELQKTFSMYETIASVAGVVMFSVTIVMIVPFVKIYTAGIDDVNYIEPAFAIMLALAGLLFCVRQPYHATVIAAGHFKQTSMAAYGEAAINIGLSIALVFKFGLIGVAIGTVTATLFRFVYYVFYISKNIIFRKISAFVKRFAINTATLVIILCGGNHITSKIVIDSYFSWVYASIIVFAFAVVITAVSAQLFYNHESKAIVQKLLRKNAN